MNLFGDIEKLKLLISKKQSLWITVIVIMMIFGAFLETLGVSGILPLVLVVTKPGVMDNNALVKSICELFDIHTEKTLVMAVVGALIAVFIIKGLFLLLEYYIQAKFVHYNKLNMQKQLLEIYLNKPYEYYLDTNFSEIFQNITENTGAAFIMLSHILAFFTEIIVSLFLLVTIFIIDPMMTILVCVVLLLLIIFLAKIIRPIMEREGRKRQKYGRQGSKWLMQAVHGIKEIKIAKRESYFLENYVSNEKRCLDAARKDSILNSLPRILIESFSVSAMLLSIVIMVWLGNDINKLLPVLSAFAMAAVRLMPSAHRIVVYMNELAYYEPALDALVINFRDLNNKNMNDDKSQITGSRQKTRFSMKTEIILSDITYHYPNMEHNVLTDAKMAIPIGKSIGIVGASGAGKTTVADILLGLLKPQKGKVLADGIDVTEFYGEWLSKIGYIPQMIFMMDDSIRSNVAFGVARDEVDDERVWKVLEEAQLADFVHGLPKGLDTEIGERGVRLSGGQRQRIGIARALYSDPDLLIFDEATSALDNDTEAAMIESVNHLHGKKTMVIIAHRLQTIEGCDIVYRVESGKIIKER